MRIIAGTYRGRKLRTVKDGSVRPATDLVKGSIFNMLQNRLGLVDAAVLDLFAGSGNLGFEALSRGAARVVFVESNRFAATSIEENAQTLQCEEQCDILQTDALSYVAHARETFDLIFADPPYAYEGTVDLPRLIFERQLLNKESFLIIEHTRKTLFPESPLYRMAVQKEFGNTRVSFFTHPQS